VNYLNNISPLSLYLFGCKFPDSLELFLWQRKKANRHRCPTRPTHQEEKLSSISTIFMQK
jgi:hypothetical protein